MTDPRWAALAAEIAYEMNPTPAKKASQRPLTRRPDFIEDTTQRGIAQLKSAALEIDYSMEGPFPVGSYVRRVSNRPSMGARPGALARVLGYGRSKFEPFPPHIVVQWSDDALRGSSLERHEPGRGQMHGGYRLEGDGFTNGGFVLDEPGIEITGDTREAVIPAAEIRERVRNFVEPKTDIDRRELEAARRSVEGRCQGRFDPGDIVMLTNAKVMSAQAGALARVLGYKRADATATKVFYVVVQWSRDLLSGDQRHGAYTDNQFAYVGSADPF